jgi:hypothetical protein
MPSGGGDAIKGDQGGTKGGPSGDQAGSVSNSPYRRGLKSLAKNDEIIGLIAYDMKPK